MNTYKVHEIYNKYYDTKYLTDRIEFRYIYKCIYTYTYTQACILCRHMYMHTYSTYKHMCIQRNVCSPMHKHT